MTKTIPAVYGSFVDVGFNWMTPFLKDGANYWLHDETSLQPMSDYDIEIMRENGMYKELHSEHPYTGQNICLAYSPSEQKQKVFDQEKWLAENSFKQFRHQPKIWGRPTSEEEIKPLMVATRKMFVRTIEGFWLNGIGTMHEYVKWSSLINSTDRSHRTIEGCGLVIAADTVLKNARVDSNLWLMGFKTEAERTAATKYSKLLMETHGF